jgi:hypothetical protein
VWPVNRPDDQRKTKPAADARAARLAAALKSNLRRRKAQARERAGVDRTDAPANDNTGIAPIAGRNEE